MNSNNPKDYWKYLKTAINQNQKNTGPTISEFYEHFKNTNTSNLSQEEDQVHDLESDPIIHNTESLNAPITIAEIDKFITKTKNGKASSQYDNILNEYLKCSKHLLSNTLCKFFNIILDTGVLPEAWLVGTIVPIYKNKGSKNVPGNYRPITILSCLGKLFTGILNDRINKFLEDNLY